RHDEVHDSDQDTVDQPSQEPLDQITRLTGGNARLLWLSGTRLPALVGLLPLFGSGSLLIHRGLLSVPDDHKPLLANSRTRNHLPNTVWSHRRITSAHADSGSPVFPGRHGTRTLSDDRCSSSTRAVMF